MPVTYRRARGADLPVLDRFQREIINAEQAFIPRRIDEEYRYYDLAPMLDAPDICVAVAEVNGELVGSGYAKKVRSKPYLQHRYHAYVGFMYTAEHCRGQGVAHGMLTYLGDWARTKGLDELRLDVFADNQRAIRAYATAGFQANTLEMRLALDDSADKR